MPPPLIEEFWPPLIESVPPPLIEEFWAGINVATEAPRGSEPSSCDLAGLKVA